MKLRHKEHGSPSQFGGHGVATTPGDEIEVDDDVGEALLERDWFERVSTDETGGSDAEDGDASGSSSAATDSDTDDLDDSEAGEWLTQLEGVGPAKADHLEDAGYAERERVEQATVEDLAAVDGVSEELAESVKEQLADKNAEE